MKTTIAALLTATLLAGPALAGGLDVPVIEQQVVVEETTSSASHGFIVPLLALLTLAAVPR